MSNTLWIWPDAPAGILSNDAGVILCDHCPCNDIFGNQCVSCRVNHTPKWWRVYFTGVRQGDLGNCTTCPEDWNDPAGFLIRQNSREDKSCYWDAREGTAGGPGFYVVPEDYFTECYQHARILMLIGPNTPTQGVITLNVSRGGTATTPPGPGDSTIFKNRVIPATNSRINCFRAKGFDLPLSSGPDWGDAICSFDQATCKVVPVLE